MAGPGHDEALSLLIDRYAQYKSMQLQGAPIVKVVIEGYVSWGRVE